MLRIAGIGVSSEFIIIPLLLIILLCWLICGHFSNDLWYAVGIFGLILLSIILSYLSGALTYGYQFAVGADILSYVGKGGVMLFCMICVIRWGSVFVRFYLSTIVYTLIIAMLLGLWQWLPVPYADQMLSLYSRSDEQILSHLDRSFISRRVTGVAYMATAHGALAGLAFIISYSLLVVRGIRYSWLVLLALSFISIYPSLSRLAMLSVVFGIAVLPLLLTRIPSLRRKAYRGALYISGVLVAVLGSISFIIWDIIERILSRWELLFIQIGEGGNRMAQVYDVIDVKESFLSWLFGTSRVGQAELQKSGTFGHIEVEFVNIVFLYGWFGFIAHYLFIIWASIYMYKSINMCVKNWYVCAMTTSLAGIIVYQVVSIGYFFFREVHVGFFIWSLIGIGLGAAYAARRQTQ